MSTVETLDNVIGADLAPSVTATRFPLHYVENNIEMGAAATAKGSGLAAGDIIEAVRLPANSIVLAAGFEVITDAVGPTTLTVDLGVTGTAVDIFVDGYDWAAGGVGDFGVQPAAFYPVVFAASDTVDVELQTLSGGTLSAGELRVWVIYGDISDQRKPGLVALKS